MQIHQRLADWLETHWMAPAYSGWLLGGLAIFFFGAATNTMAGWLYVISGVMLALLAIAALLPERMLRGIYVTRCPIEPVSVGDTIVIELRLENRTNQAKSLIQVQDLLPYVLSQPVQRAIEVIPPGETQTWVYYLPANRRGIYRWHTVQLRTASPLGLFWCRRSQVVKAMAIVYPTVLPLSQCPLIDDMGQDTSTQVLSDYQAKAATEGLTRTLRPYRWGDAIRLIHWRSSARYGELRMRELETYTGGQELVICLDSAIAWEVDTFEQAVVAAASLYFYAVRHKHQVSLWTAATGVIRGDRVILETLAAVHPLEQREADPPNLPLLWLSQNPESLKNLPLGSRWLLWLPSAVASDTLSDAPLTHVSGITIQPDEPLQLQLQSPSKHL